MPRYVGGGKPKQTNKQTRATANQKYTILNMILNKPTVLQIPLFLSTETISVESFWNWPVSQLEQTCCDGNNSLLHQSYCTPHYAH